MALLLKSRGAVWLRTRGAPGHLLSSTMTIADHGTRDFANPAAGIVVNGAGRVFAVDHGSTVIREVLPEGRSVVVAEGIRSPVGLALDRDGTLLVSAWGDGNVWRVKL